MKKLSILCLVLFIGSFIASCGSPYKSRKRCRGNGSWHGNRGLGSIDKVQKNNQNTYYAVVAKEVEEVSN